MFDQLGSQWLVGPVGAYGLSYPAIESTLTLLRVKRRRWPELFADLRVLEAAALAQMQLTKKQAA